LQARLQRLRARAEYRVTDRLGAARPDGDRRRRSSGGGARHRLSHRAARRRRFLERAALHRDRFPPRVLSALPRLCEILPALGAGALPQSQERQCAGGGVRDVIARCAQNGRTLNYAMRIIARRTLREFVDSLAGHKDQPAVKASLDAWFHEVAQARWSNTADLKRSY